MATTQLALDTERIQRQIMALQGNVNLTVQRELRKALRETQKTLAVAFAKYGTDGALSKVEMARYNRQVSLYRELQREVDKTLVKVNDTVKLLPPASYQEAYYRNGWALSKTGPGQALNYGMLPTEAIREAVLINPIVGATLEEMTADTVRVTQRKIRQNVTRGIIRGDSYAQMAADLEDAMGATAVRYDRIVRTEGQRAMNMGQQATYAEAREEGVEVGEEWIATADKRTRPAHGTMDGRRKNIETGLFDSPDVGGVPGPLQSGVASFDINCRCAVMPIVPGLEPLQRRVEGEDEPVDFISYEDWRKGQGIRPVKETRKLLGKGATVEDVAIAFANQKEAEAWFANTLGIDDVKNVRLTNMDLEILGEYAKGARDMLAEFPMLKGHLKNLQTSQATRFYAVYKQERMVPKGSQLSFVTGPHRGRIAVSRKVAATRAEMLKSMADDIANGFHYEGMNVASTMTHELAHALDAQMRLSRRGLDVNHLFTRVEWQDYVSDWNTNRQSFIHDAIDAAYKDFGFDNVAHGTVIAQTADEARRAYELTKPLGRYAHTNKKELFAQAIADAITSANPDPFSLAVLKHAKELAR